MSGMTPERLADIRERHSTGLGLERPGDVAALLAEVERLRDLIRARDAEVRAETLSEFTREDRRPFFGHDFTEPGYWRLVGPKHYKPIPTAEQLSDETLAMLRRRLGGERA
ncbi:hypothetical protein [Janibacter sp. LM]|uniref:hypothetical protein n=1 Tax=Janibacter sp. LM TaxID=3144845 RepID=UPI0031F64601